MDAETEMTVSGEYDDNINLENDEDAKEDFVLHLSPVIDALLPYKDHKFSLNVDLDYKKGIKQNELSDVNVDITGAMDFLFAEKVKLGLKNEYTDRRFDNAIYDESGITQRRENISGISFEYKFIERLKAQGKYEHTWEEIKDEDWYDEQRYTDMVDGKIFVPVTDFVESYVAYFFETQECDENITRNYDDQRYAAGLKWTGPYRFSAWLEGGHETIDFDSPYMEDYDNIVFKIGVGVKFTEPTRGELSLGQDGYGNFIYNGFVDYKYADTSVRFSIDKKTSVSFSTLYPTDALDINTASLQITRKFIERFTLNLKGSYHTLDSYTQNAIRKDKIWSGRLSIYYLIQEWFNVGIHYQYSQRESQEDAYDYKNNRAGIFAMFKF